MSNLERVIFRILINSKVKFIQEKIFKDLRNGLYKFDFYLPGCNMVIEVNGLQHYTYNKFFYKKRSDFTKAQERDRQKISYCLANNIKIYCIPYWEIDNIKKFEDITQKKFLATSKFHNDEVWKQRRKK